jgi:cell division protein FtsB
MVVRKRARRILIPLMLYGVSAALAAYFMHNAQIGRHGLEAQQQYEAEVAELDTELQAARTERSEWERRIALLRSDQIDRDLLEERARIVLGRVHRNDLVIMTGPPGP